MKNIQDNKAAEPAVDPHHRRPKPRLPRRRLVAVSAAVIAGAVLVFVLLQMAQLSKSASAMGDWPYYGSPSAAMGAADVVVTAMYIDSRTATIYPLPSDSTDPVLNPQAGIELSQGPKEVGLDVVISRVAVLTSLKGELEVGRVIEVTQPGTTFLGISYPAAGATFIGDIAQEANVSGAESSILLLLSQHPDSSYSPINPDEGVFLIQDNQVLPTDPDMAEPTDLSAYLDAQ